MFNLAPFNQTPFNRSISLEQFISMRFDGEGGLILDAARTTTAAMVMHGEGTISLAVGKETAVTMQFDGEGGVTFNFGKLRLANMLWNGEGTLIINNESFTIFIMEYFGELKPNDRVIINMERFTVTKNNQNDLENFDGNFINLKEGINEIRFEDGESSRTVLIRIEHKDRFV